MLGRKLFERALGIESPWYIKSIEFDEDEQRLDIKIDFKRGSKFKYSEGDIEGMFKAYDTKEKTWRHLNFFQHECYLHARVPRIKTDNGKVRMIKAPWEGKSKGFTLLFEALVLQLCTAMPVHQVEKLINESDDKIWRMLAKYIEEALELNDYSDVESIGIDETSKRSGHNYITLFVDMVKKRTIFITKGKDSNTVKDFVKDFEGTWEEVVTKAHEYQQKLITLYKESIPTTK